MNAKEQGEESVKIVIGELAKYHIGCAILLTDNEPYDFIVIYKGRLLKAQVKSSSIEGGQKEVVSNSVKFKCCTSNWHKRTVKKYKPGDYEVMFFVDMRDYSIYLVEAEKTFGIRTFTIRTSPSKNGQIQACNMKEDYLLSQDRIEAVFDKI
ncbi:MAG: group I intron-associated PD-(D/E)XK endonuclease [Candidatus Cloacimonetes bacterium]|jgi:hypothetical protein|nr:group I intron-associated PD-(D/E)XK endonuclease [Candidatus Cloacimonadota bacterium]